MSNPVVHFVGFKDDRFWNAVKVFGYPHFFHRWWDVRAEQELAPGDTMVFADGNEFQTPNKYTFDDSSVVAGQTDQKWGPDED